MLQGRWWKLFSQEFIPVDSCRIQRITLPNQWTRDLVAPLSVTVGEREGNMCLRKKKEEESPVVVRGYLFIPCGWVMRLKCLGFCVMYAFKLKNLYFA